MQIFIDKSDKKNLKSDFLYLLAKPVKLNITTESQDKSTNPIFIFMQQFIENVMKTWLWYTVTGLFVWFKHMILYHNSNKYIMYAYTGQV